MVGVPAEGAVAAGVGAVVHLGVVVVAGGLTLKPADTDTARRHGHCADMAADTGADTTGSLRLV